MAGGTVSPPLCFLHVPKSAGTSLHESLQAAFPDGSVAPRRMDTSMFCGFSEFGGLDERVRSMVAVDRAEVSELAAYRVVSGHFSLPTLLRLAPAGNVATVLREPRARMLSGYMFLRLTSMADYWGPYGSEVLGPLAGPIGSGSSDPRLAPHTDNVACRLILDGDPRIPARDFIAPEDVDAVAEAALDRVDRLGSVTILEVDDVWARMSDFFDVPLEPVRAHVTGTLDVAEGALPLPPYDMREMLEMLDERGRADRLVYDTLLVRRCGSVAEARRIADAAFATELVRFGDLMGESATTLGRLRTGDVDVA